MTTMRVCLICDGSVEHGLEILTEFICLNCMEEITRITAKDPKYNEYVSKVKKIWFQHMVLMNH